MKKPQIRNETYYAARRLSIQMVPETCPMMLAAERDLADIFCRHLKHVYDGPLPPEFRIELLERMDVIFNDLKETTTIRLREAFIQVIIENMLLKAEYEKAIVNETKCEEQLAKQPIGSRMTAAANVTWFVIAFALQFAASIVLLPITLLFWCAEKWETRRERVADPF